MKCTRCGFNNYDGMRICKNCGATLNNSLLNQQNTNYNGYNNTYNTYNNQQNINNLQYQPITQDYNNIKMYKEKKPIGKIIAVLALVIFMTALLIGTIYLYLENHGFLDKEKPSNTSQIEVENNEENKEEKEDKLNKDEENTPTPTPTKKPTTTPTPTETIDKNSFFGKIEDMENYKLIGSKNVGYMIVPYETNIQKMESNSIKYATDDNSATISITTYITDNLTLQEKSLEVIESIENGSYFTEDVRTNGGLTSNCEYINIKASFPNEALYLNGYLVKYNNDKENTYHWIAIEYTMEQLNDYANLFNNYTIKITDKIPEDLYNESDHLQ